MKNIDLSMFDNIENPYFCLIGTPNNPKLPLAVAKIKDKWEILTEIDEKTGKPKLKGVKPSIEKSEGWLNREELKEASKSIKKDIASIIYGGVACIDLDHCLNENKEPNDFAKEILSYFPDTYTEISRSGEGLHIFLKYSGGKLVNSIRKSDSKENNKFILNSNEIDLEMYSCNKIIFLTGDRINDKNLEDKTSAFDETYDKYFSIKKEKKTASKKRQTENYKSITPNALQRIINSIVDKLRNAQGNRNNTLRDCAIGLGNYCNYITESEAHDMLYNAWVTIHPNENADREFESTFKSGWEYGVSRPKDLDIHENYTNNSVSNDSKSDKEQTYEIKYKPSVLKNDTDQAKVFVKYYGDKVKFCEGFGFMAYDEGEKIWKFSKADVQKYMTELIEKQEKEANILEDQEYKKHVLKYKNAAGERGVFYILERMIQIDSSNLDSDPYIINTPSCVIDLRNGKERLHSKQDYCTKITARSSSDNNKEKFQDFLDTITQSNEKLQNYLQEIAGQAIIGKASKKVYFLSSNIEGTGKSTFIKLLRLVFGGYSAVVPIDLITKKLNGAEKNSAIMKLKGVRFATASEIERGNRLDPVFIKQSTSNDGMTGKHMGCDFVDFYPSHTLFISTNYMPESDMIDGAIKDRISVFGFHKKIRDTEKDKKDYEEILFNKPDDKPSGYDCGGAVLKWAVEGAERWIKNGNKFSSVPECVKRETQEYFDENDVIKNFLDEYFISFEDTAENRKKYRVKVTDVYSYYTDYCEKHKYSSFNKSDFKGMMSERFKTIKSNGIEFYSCLTSKTNIYSNYEDNVKINNWINETNPTIYGERTNDMYKDFNSFCANKNYNSIPDISSFNNCIMDSYHVEIKEINIGEKEKAEIFVESDYNQNNSILN